MDAPPVVPAKKRYHDLDALRSFAMLLGIVIHGLLSYMPLPIWPAQDINQSPAYALGLYAIHGFRMPLFFLVSGFFTAMLWRQRGLGALIGHRARRIGLPLLVFGFVCTPLLYGLLFYGYSKQDEVSARDGGKPAHSDRGADEEKSKELWEEFQGTLPGWARVVSVIVLIVFIASIIPIFHHLWFLYYLLWLVAGFALVAWWAGRSGWKRWPDWIVLSSLRGVWWGLLTMIPQGVMIFTFGGDTATGLIPWPPKLLYFAIFFGFGALCYGRDGFEEKVGRWWPLHFALAVPVFILGVRWFEMRNGMFDQGLPDPLSEVLVLHGLNSLCSVAYAWLMVFGFLGFFRRFFSGENRGIRYVSDSSYWLYVAHLPLIMTLQIVISDWNIPHVPKFLFVCTVTTGSLLLMYKTFVRHTWIGTMLNGKRTREAEPAGESAG